jgi:hypothetical protein
VVPALVILMQPGAPHSSRVSAWLPGFLRATGAAVVCVLLAGAASQPSEYQVKAVFLFHFTQFVEWPSTAFDTPADPMVIAVLGADPFGSFLDEVVRDESVDGRPIVVRRYARPEEVGPAHILFISGTEVDQLEQALALLSGRSILTVGEGEDFAARGVMIRFRTLENRVRLRINVGALRSAGLSVSSKLLRSAELVNPDVP